MRIVVSPSCLDGTDGLAVAIRESPVAVTGPTDIQIDVELELQSFRIEADDGAVLYEGTIDREAD